MRRVEDTRLRASRLVSDPKKTKCETKFSVARKNYSTMVQVQV